MTTTAAVGTDLEVLRDTLRTKVVDILRREIVALRPLERQAAYEAVMNQPTLLDSCFKTFRARPHLFAEIMVDERSQPVAGDDSPLSCGRSVSEIVTLVVRAAARRYFRSRLSVRRPAPPRPLHPSGMRRLAIALGLAKPPPPLQAQRADSPAERLYKAIRDYLLYEWQVILIPHYTPLAPERVAALGSRLLDVREPAELRALASPGNDRDDGRPPLLLDDARRLLVKGADTIDAEVLWRVCQQMDLVRLFPDHDMAACRRAVAQVAALQRGAIDALMPVLGADIRRFTAFIMVAYITLGEQRFRQVFVQEGQATVIRRWAERLSRADVPPPRLDAMKRAYQDILAATAAEPQALEPGTDVAVAKSEILEALARLPPRKPG